MAIYQIGDTSFKKVEQTTFSEQGIKERSDLQRLLKSQIEVIADDVMVIFEEFGDWDGSKRRVDL